MNIADRLTYAAFARCRCGAGLAYRSGDRAWDCGDILRFDSLSPEEQARVKAAQHDEPAPFAFYEVKGENQPSARGATTRPQEAVG